MEKFDEIRYIDRYERRGYKTFKEIPLEVAFAADSSASESARGQVTFPLFVSINSFSAVRCG